MHFCTARRASSGFVLEVRALQVFYYYYYYYYYHYYYYYYYYYYDYNTSREKGLELRKDFDLSLDDLCFAPI